MTALNELALGRDCSFVAEEIPGGFSAKPHSAAMCRWPQSNDPRETCLTQVVQILRNLDLIEQTMEVGREGFSRKAISLQKVEEVIFTKQ